MHQLCSLSVVGVVFDSKGYVNTSFAQNLIVIFSPLTTKTCTDPLELMVHPTTMKSHPDESCFECFTLLVPLVRAADVRKSVVTSLLCLKEVLWMGVAGCIFPMSDELLTVSVEDLLRARVVSL